MKVIATNRKARFNYELITTYEAGIELKGSEVKSLRQGKISLQESYVIIRQQEAYIINLHISAYEYATNTKLAVDRTRKLLLHKKEIVEIEQEMKLAKLQLIPIEMYFNVRNIVKVKISLAKAKKLYDKRETIKKRDIERRLKKVK